MKISGQRVNLWRQTGGNKLGEGSASFVIARSDDETPIGRIHYRMADPATGWLTIDEMELAPSLRGWGYGSEAVRLLEGEAMRLGLASGFMAEVPVSNGLALYFWLRLGYRPAKDEETFWRSAEGMATMAMIRTPN